MRWVVLVDYAENAGGIETFGPFTSHDAGKRARRKAEARFGATTGYRDVSVLLVPLRPARALGEVG